MHTSEPLTHSNITNDIKKAVKDFVIKLAYLTGLWKGLLFRKIYFEKSNQGIAFKYDRDVCVHSACSWG